MKIHFHDLNRTVEVPDGTSDDEIDDIHDSVMSDIGGKPGKPEHHENVLQRASKAMRPIVGPSYQMLGHGMNTAAFGLPGIVMDKTLSPEVKSYIKPQGIGEHLGATAGDIGGFMVGGPEKIAAKGVENFLPKGASFLARTGRGVGQGMAAMGSLEAPQVLSGNENPLIGALKTAGGGLLQGGVEGFGPPIARGVGSTIGAIKKFPARVGEIFKAPAKSAEIGSQIANIEGQIARSEAEASAPNMSRKGESIIKKAHKNIQDELETNLGKLENESRSIFVKHTPVAKKRMSQLTKNTYDTYGKILEGGEEEASKGFAKEGLDASELYRQQVIDPVLNTIEQTGAKTPAAEKFKKLFTVKEGLSDSATSTADDAVLENFNKLSGIEKMKALRSSLYKEGSEDFIQTQYSDLHQKFIGKYSPTVAKANESYGPMKQALRWGNKNLKPFYKDEVKKVADIVQKANNGTLDETQAAYLKTLKNGVGDFKGKDITKLEAVHQQAVDGITSKIKETQSMIKNLESQTASDIATVRSGGMQQTAESQNILKNVASNKSKLSQLKELRKQVERDVRSRDDLIRFGIISGLSGLGVGTGVYALARALHEK